MATVRLQDLTAIIHATSRYNGGKYDTVHVENIIQTDEPIDTSAVWYVPNGVTSNPVADLMFHTTNMPMYPRSEAELLEGTQDIFDEAKQGKVPELTEDASKLMMMSMMKKTSLTAVADTINLYCLAYDYKIFPDITDTNKFKFVSELPFNGLALATNGGVVQMSVIMPLGAKINADETKGTATNGQNIEEQVHAMDTVNRNVVTFRYNIDPLFDIVYNY